MEYQTKDGKKSHAECIKAVHGSKEAGYVFVQENGIQFKPSPEQVGNITPQNGDYVVTQPDGKVLIVPAQTFQTDYKPVNA